MADGWRKMTATCLDLLGDLLETLTATEWASPSLCAGWSVREVAAHLVWRVSSGPLSRSLSVSTIMLARRESPAGAIEILAKEDLSTPAVLLTALRNAAAARRDGHGGQGVGDLTEVVVHGYDIARPLLRPLGIPPVASGAVVLARVVASAATAGTILRHRTLVAVDADWSLGSGPYLLGTAEDHVLLLFGRLPLPPQPIPPDLDTSDHAPAAPGS